MTVNGACKPVGARLPGRLAVYFTTSPVSTDVARFGWLPPLRLRFCRCWWLVAPSCVSKLLWVVRLLLLHWQQSQLLLLQ